jgi:hypothetical protein
MFNTSLNKKRKLFDLSQPLSGAVYNRSSYKQNDRVFCECCGKYFGHFKQHILTNEVCNPYWMNKLKQQLRHNEIENNNHWMLEDNTIRDNKYDWNEIIDLLKFNNNNVNSNDDKNSTIDYIKNIYSDTFGLNCMNAKTYDIFLEKIHYNQVSFPNKLTSTEIELFVFANRTKLSTVEGNNIFRIITSILQFYCNDYNTQYRTFKTVKKYIKEWCEKRYTHYELSYVEWPDHWKMDDCKPTIPKVEMYHVNLLESVQLLLGNPDIMLNEEYCDRIMFQAKEAFKEIDGVPTPYASHLMTGLNASVI